MNALLVIGFGGGNRGYPQTELNRTEQCVPPMLHRKTKMLVLLWLVRSSLLCFTLLFLKVHSVLHL